MYCCVFTSITPRVVMRSVGMTGSAMKLSVIKGIDAAAHTEAERSVLRCLKLLVHFGQRLIRHNARDFQNNARQDLFRP